MAISGSPKRLSQLHEQRVATRYGGKVSPSSGAANTDQGDVRTDEFLIECKHTGTYDKPAKSISVNLAVVEKIADEAWSEGREWMIALSLYAPDSILAGSDGFVDFSLRDQNFDVALLEIHDRN